MRVVIDIEANGLENPDKIWCVVCKDIDTGEINIFRNIVSNAEENYRCLQYLNNCSLIVGHNILGYDLPVLSKLCKFTSNVGMDDGIRDTLIVSRLADYSRQGGHSIEQYGQEFGYPKIEFNDFSKFSEEMVTYCIRDVEIAEKVYRKYQKIIDDPSWSPSIKLEHEFQLIVNDLHDNGFAFNSTKAQKILDEVTASLSSLDKEIADAFPERLKLIREIHPKVTKHGTLSRTDFRWVADGDLSIYNGGPFSRCEWVSFNPSSHKQIISILNNAGWKPVNKTKTHIEVEREYNRLKNSRQRDNEFDIRLKELYIKLESARVSGWKVDEENISTLPNVNECRIKTTHEEQNIIENIIGKMLKPSESRLGEITIKIQEILKKDNSVESTECLLKILKRCLKDNLDYVKFVESEKHLWSIIATPQGMFVDCSASYATDISDGLKDLTPKRQIILETLRQSFHQAPPPSRLLAKRILLEARRRTLTEWLSLVGEDGRIHGEFFGIGAWTHRMAHRNPNTANIPNEFDTQGNKKLYGKEMRSLWVAPKNRLLVGVDAEGIQLRIFAHYINDPEFTRSLVEGKKDDKTDPHSLNQRILGSVCKSRAAAKRFIYALLLGAGLPKLAEILGCSVQEAQQALDRLISRYTGWAILREKVFPQDARRGYFIGLDDRKVPIPGDTDGSRRHLAMSGYLQNGEAVCMKLATVKFYPELQNLGGKLVNFVHDEWQSECKNNMEVAIQIAKLKADALRQVGEDLKLNCPLAGSYWNDDIKDYTIGTNWSVTH